MKKFEEAELEVMTIENNVIVTSGCPSDDPCSSDSICAAGDACEADY